MVIRWNLRIFQVSSSNFEVNLPRSLTKWGLVPPSGKLLGCRGPTYYDIPYVPLQCFRCITLTVDAPLPFTPTFKKGRALPWSLRKAAGGAGFTKNHREHHLTASPLQRDKASPESFSQRPKGRSCPLTSNSKEMCDAFYAFRLKTGKEGVFEALRQLVKRRVSRNGFQSDSENGHRWWRRSD